MFLSWSAKLRKVNKLKLQSTRAVEFSSKRRGEILSQFSRSQEIRPHKLLLWFVLFYKIDHRVLRLQIGKVISIFLCPWTILLIGEGLISSSRGILKLIKKLEIPRQKVKYKPWLISQAETFAWAKSFWQLKTHCWQLNVMHWNFPAVYFRLWA